MATRFVVAALALLAFAPPAGAALASAAKLRHEVRGLVAAGVPGAVVVVRDGGKAVRVAGGSARLKPRQPMRIADRFRIGSVTKTYVAAVVLQLAGEGKLTLDDSVERWLPGMVPNGANITLRELLNHHSGLFVSDARTGRHASAPSERVPTTAGAGESEHNGGPRSNVS